MLQSFKLAAVLLQNCYRIVPDLPPKKPYGALSLP